jgi:hypothetical protein
VGFGAAAASTSAGVGDRAARIIYAATRSECLDHLGMPSRALLGGGILGTKEGPLSHGRGYGNSRVARVGLSNTLLSPAFHPYHEFETSAPLR